MCMYSWLPVLAIAIYNFLSHIMRGYTYVTGFEITHLPRTIINIDFNYLKYNSRRKTDA